MSTWEVVGALFGLVSVWLTVRESIWCWPIGLVTVGAYVVVFWHAKLYADTGLQVVYVVLSLYGWWAWLHGGADARALRVERTPGWAWGVSTLVSMASTAALGALLYSHTDAAMPYWDAGTTSVSLVAQWLQTRKWIENWWLWIAVDAVYVGMYIVKHLYLTAGLYAAYLLLAIVGWRAWRKSLERSTEAV
ncbi:MAG: nicotinamide riboside transporter PnuC [Acidobacteriota bacterium]